MGEPLCPDGIKNRPRILAGRLIISAQQRPLHAHGVGKTLPLLPQSTAFFVVSTPIIPPRPVRGIVSPLSAGLLRISSGVSPCAACHTMVPRIQIHRADLPVRRLQHRKTLHRKPTKSALAWRDHSIYIRSVRFSRPRWNQPDGADRSLRKHVKPCGSLDRRTHRPQSVPPKGSPTTKVPTGPFVLLITGGVNTGPSLYCDATFSASARSAGVKSIKSSIEEPFRP